jgi:hypothetical protein
MAPADIAAIIMRANEGVQLYNFTIEDMKVSVTFEIGDTSSVEDSLTSAECRVVCAASGNAEAGLPGTLIAW